MKRYIRSTTVTHNAKSLCTAIIDTLSSEGIGSIKIIQARRAGMSGSGFTFTYRYREPNEEYFLGEYAAKYGQEAGQRALDTNIIEHSNFIAIQDITDYTPGTEDKGSYHRGGGFKEMDYLFLDHVKSIAESYYPDAELVIDRHGLYGIETTVEIRMFLPK